MSLLIISRFREFIAAAWLANTATLELSISSQFIIYMCLSFLVTLFWLHQKSLPMIVGLF